MAAVEITISGILYDKQAKTSQQVALIGEAILTDLSVGGGPIIPEPPKPEEPPPGIWPGPGDPDFPGDGKPDVPPPSIWPDPGDPDYPILNPPDKPIEPGTIITWTPVWTPGKGWFVIGVPNVPHPAPSSAA